MTIRTQLSLRHTGHTAAPTEGSALIVTVLTVAVLCLIAGTLMSLTSSKQSGPFQAASWHEAGSAAEGGVEIALNALRRKISDGDTAAWSGWQTLEGTTFAKKYITENDLLSHDGEGNTTVRAIVEISLPTGANTINPTSISSNRYSYLIRSTGLANVPGPSRLSQKKSDLDLRKINVFRDMRTANVITTPQVTRVVEAIASPVTPFPAAILARETIEIKGGSNMIVDSYDPKVTPFKYDGSKTPGTIDSRKTNGNICTNAKKKDNTDVIRLENVKVYGLAAKGKGAVNIKSNASVSGEIIDGFYRELTPVQSPRNNPAFIPSGSLALDDLDRPHSTVNLMCGAPGSSNYYKVKKIHLHKDDKLVVKKNGAGGGTAELWVTGDVIVHKEGVIEVENGANLIIYAEKNITLEEKDASHPAVKNEAVYTPPSPQPSGWTAFTDPTAFQVYGVVPNRNHKHCKIKTNLSGVIYAPDHEFEVKLKSGRHFYGSLTGRKFQVEKGTQVHYDESLSDMGKPFDYTLESWQEDWYDPNVRQAAVP